MIKVNGSKLDKRSGDILFNKDYLYMTLVSLN